MKRNFEYRRQTIEKSHWPRLRFVFACFFVKLSFDLAYASYLQVDFGAHFLTPFPLKFSILRYIESNLWVLMVAMIVPFNSRNMSGSFFACALIFLFLPLATMFGMDYERTRMTLALTTLAIFVSYIASAAKFTPLRIPVPANGRTFATMICALSLLYFLALSAATGTLFRMNFNLDLIYILRGEAENVLDVGILGYLNLWTQKVLTPFLLAIGLSRRSWWMIILATMMHVVYFGVTQHRMHLFVPALVVLVWYVYKRGFSFATGFLIIGLGVAMSTTLAIFSGLEFVGAVMLRRAFFVGASVTDSWVNFFLERPKVFFSDNLLSSVVVNDYTGVPLPYYLGDYFQPGLDLAFNAGLVATGYAQLGVIGVAFYALILGLFLRSVNALIRSGVPVFMPAAIIFLPLRIAWVDSDLFTALLSHGLIVSLVMVWLYGRYDRRAQSLATSGVELNAQGLRTP